MSSDTYDQLWCLLDTLRKGDEESGPEPDHRCHLCGNTNLISDEGEHLCGGCNAVLGRVIDIGAEWRFYGADDNRSDDPTRCGMPTNDLLPRSSIGSVFGNSKGNSREGHRIRMYQMWNSMPYWERTLYNVFEQLTSKTANQGIHNKILDDAKVLYKKVSEKKISRGDNKEGLIASCVYYACLLNKVPRSTKEIASMFHIDPNVLTKGNARFQDLLKLNVECTGSDDFVCRFGSKLSMDWNDIQKCKELAKRLDDLEIVSENAPTSVAAGTIYYYCMEHNIEFNKKQIAEVCGVSEVTIMKCYKRLLKYKNIIHPINEP
jgi:transcription initiation factor TFIIIB Brf1 subunit/transcription initiation factor TFIIB